MPYHTPFEGRQCAFSWILQFVANCDPPIKYMSNLFDHRHETYGLVDLFDIDDTRNGILLNAAFHSPLDDGVIAFMMVCDLLSFLSIPCNSSI